MTAPLTSTTPLHHPGEVATTAARAAPGFEQALRRASSPASATEVPLQRTVLSPAQARSALADAWTQLHGSPPKEGTLDILLAQWAHETGGGASMYNYNFGGIKGAGPSGLTASARTREGYGASERVIRDHFRAYSSAQEGARDYLSLLSRRFPDAVTQAGAGDPAAFVDALHRGGYFTGSKEAYTASIVRLSGVALPDRSAGNTPVVASRPPQHEPPRPSAPRLDRLAGEVRSYPIDDAMMSMVTAGLVDAMSQSSFRILAEPAEPTE